MKTSWYSRKRVSFPLLFFELLVTLTQLPSFVLSLCRTLVLVVQDNTQEGIVDAKSAVVLDEAQLPEFVHEKIDPWACCADHLRQHLLRHFGKYLLRLVQRAITREQQQGACQPFLAGVEELVDQILFDSDVACQHIGYESVGELVFAVEDANHLPFLNDEHGGGCNRGRSRHASRLARKTAFPKEIARSQNRYNGFFAGLMDHGKLHAAFPNVHDILCGVALREDSLFLSKVDNLPPKTGRIEEQFHIEIRAS